MRLVQPDPIQFYCKKCGAVPGLKCHNGYGYTKGFQTHAARRQAAREAFEVELAEQLAKYSQEFDELTQERHIKGAETYGPVNFMSVDTIRMAMEEVADLSNYARYTYIKLCLLRDALMGEIPTALGVDGFFGVNEKEKGPKG